MAKNLGAKSTLIREALTNNPDLGNKEISELLNGSDDRKKDKIKVTPQDIAQQKQIMKKAGQAVASKSKQSQPKASRATPATANVVEDMEAIKRLVQRLGGEQVKRIVGLFE